MKITNEIQSVMSPPVSLANALKALCPADLDLLDFSQAVPGYPPHEALIEHAISEMRNPLTHKYAPALGLPELRQTHARQLGITTDNVAITAGCNQAFAVAMQCLARRGRSVLLPTPYYFNHQMTLQMQGFNVIEWPCRADMSLDWERLPELMSEDVIAIVLVTPNNPTGYVTPPDQILRLLDYASEHSIHLVLDETYCDFVEPEHLTTVRVHPNLIRVYSFSKAYAIAGHRVGSLVAPIQLIEQAEKVIDCWAICAPRIGQHLALKGIEVAEDWVAQWRAQIAEREQVLLEVIDSLSGLQIQASGAYFAWVRYDEPIDSVAMAQRWVSELGILALPAHYFGSNDRAMRLAFANQDAEGIKRFGQRLSD